MREDILIDRRTLLAATGAGLAAMMLPGSAAAVEGEARTKPIPSTGEQIPVIGLGTWQTFNVGQDPELREARTRVLQAFFDHGGGLIDSSPMYGSSQPVLGWGLERLGFPEGLFAADKIWTRDGDATREQLETSRGKWRVPRFDLMQVHNLLAWREHLPALRRLKEQGAIRYVGVTTSHGRRHGELERLMKTEPLDFVQLTYNAVDRAAEERLLPLAKDQGIAVIANRPFRGGSLVDRFQDPGRPLPDWASEIDCANWPQFLLKFIVSHPAVTCAIPATTQVVHVQENMGAARGALPDAATRERMLQYMG